MVNALQRQIRGLPVWRHLQGCDFRVDLRPEHKEKCKMPHILDAHPLKSTLGDFIAGLQSLEKEPITSPRVLEYMTQMQPSAVALTPYLLWNREHYTRNLIYRDDFFEVIALCWLPRQRTPIHSHDGQLCWLTVLQGELVCRNYRFIRPESKKPVQSTGHRSKSARPVEVELLNSTNFQADGRVAVVDRRQTTHQIENLEKMSLGSVSLHVYSKPIDSCVLFDEGTRCCERQRLQYYSAFGTILETSRQFDERLMETAAEQGRHSIPQAA
jgi:cysteine dioxygenase